MTLTVQSAGSAWLHTLETRKRRPAKPATLKTFESYLHAHINPFLGPEEVSNVSNARMKDFVAHLSSKELRPKTILEVSNAVRQIVASVVDANGNQVYPRTWNADFIDAPVVTEQRQPTVTAAEIEKAIADAPESDAILYLLLAASGLRIGEALAIRTQPSETSSFFFSDAIVVRTSMWRNREQDPKTPSARRTVELARTVSERVVKFIGNRDGFLFGNGKPATETTLRDHLADRGLPGFHAFRRFRATHLRKNRVQEDLIRAWLGHASGSITDNYSKLSEDAEFRREIAEKVGIGFSF